MSRLFFDYLMEIEYSNPVDSCYFTIKCIPKDTCRQKVSDIKIELLPDAPYSEGTDSFGNGYIYGQEMLQHDMFSFHITGQAEVIENFEEEASDSSSMMYIHPHGLNKAGNKLKAYYESLAKYLSGNDYEKAQILMHKLYEEFKYESGSTKIDTSAEEAWSQGKGVCQDYAHIMIALCQMAGIKARYVCGLMSGEGQSHAWVEVLFDNKWYPLDPTNNMIVGEQYIKLGCGRDAFDCQINRGIIRGDGGKQTQKISATVKMM